MIKKLLLRNPEITRSLSAFDRYQIKYILLLVFIPLLCGVLQLMLFYVFAELNLYFLEANGLPLDQQVREGYFQQLEIELFSMFGYLALQLLATAVAATMVMRWATAPFISATRSIDSALKGLEPSKPNYRRWLSECPAFDRIVSDFSRAVRAGKKEELSKPRGFATNYPFLIKFVVLFGVLSVSTGYVMSIAMDSVYLRTVSLSLQLVKTNQFVGHYFLAQQEILQKANNFTVGLSLLLYFLVGLQISRYMGNMITLFTRSIREDHFPITLRSTDIYGELVETLNEGRQRLG